MNILILKFLLSGLRKFIEILFYLFSPKNITNNDYSNLRVFLINFVIKIQNIVFKKINYPLNIYRKSNQELYVDVDGILLDTSYTYRYLKLTKNTKYFNQGQKNWETLISQIDLLELKLYLKKSINNLNSVHTKIRI